MKLNHYIASCGISSRRVAGDLVKAGRVTVNGTLQTAPGYNVNSDDSIKIDGKSIALSRRKLYIILNKPAGYVTTTSDEKGRPTVMDLIKTRQRERIYPIGRLDFNSTGVLLFTNDGFLANKLSHPRYMVNKVYNVTLSQPVTQKALELLGKGVLLSDGRVKVERVSYCSKRSKNSVRIVLHSGKYRVLRRIFSKLGYSVKKLDRVSYAGISKQGLPVGRSRTLTSNEVTNLKGIVDQAGTKKK